MCVAGNGTEISRSSRFPDCQHLVSIDQSAPGWYNVVRALVLWNNLAVLHRSGLICRRVVTETVVYLFYICASQMMANPVL